MIERELLVWQHLREATDLGWHGWQRWSDNRMRFLPMAGIAIREHGKLIGVGGVIWFGIRATGMFNITEDFRGDRRSRWVHRLAIKVLDEAHKVSPVIHATPDPDVPRSVEFLQRLGFEPDGETWVHDVHPGSIRSNRLFCSDERAGDCVSGSGHR
jgi:RimJ/RimL family protein N-acetyltransferase